MIPSVAYTKNAHMYVFTCVCVCVCKGEGFASFTPRYQICREEFLSGGEGVLRKARTPEMLHHPTPAQDRRTEACTSGVYDNVWSISWNTFLQSAQVQFKGEPISLDMHADKIKLFCEKFPPQKLAIAGKSGILKSLNGLNTFRYRPQKAKHSGPDIWPGCNNPKINFWNYSLWICMLSRFLFSDNKRTKKTFSS